MTAAWGGIASSKPPCTSVSLREATLTYHNIKQTETFTVNIPSEKYLKEKRKNIVDISRLNSRGTSLFPKVKHIGNIGSSRWF